MNGIIVSNDPVNRWDLLGTLTINVPTNHETTGSGMPASYTTAGMHQGAENIGSAIRDAIGSGYTSRNGSRAWGIGGQSGFDWGGRSSEPSAQETQLSPASTSGSITDNSRKGDSAYLSEKQRLEIFNQALANVQKHLPRLVSAATGDRRYALSTNTALFQKSTFELYPDLVYKGNGKIMAYFTINKNTNVEFVEAMIVHGFTHAKQITDGAPRAEFTACQEQYNYEKSYHSSILPDVAKFAESNGVFMSEAQFNSAYVTGSSAGNKAPAGMNDFLSNYLQFQ